MQIMGTTTTERTTKETTTTLFTKLSPQIQEPRFEEAPNVTLHRSSLIVSWSAPVRSLVESYLVKWRKTMDSEFQKSRELRVLRFNKFPIPNIDVGQTYIIQVASFV